MAYDVIAPATLRARIDAGESLRLLDVRTPSEFAQVRAKGAINVPLDTVSVERVCQALPGHGPLYVLCAAGTRARMAADKLGAMPDLVVVDGGTKAWETAGLPVERTAGAPATISVERQLRIIIGSGVVAGAVLGYVVHPAWIGLSGFFGAGLVFAGLTDLCPLALVVQRLPWNRSSSGAACCRM